MRPAAPGTVNTLAAKEYATSPDGPTTTSVVCHVTENPGVAKPSATIFRMASCPIDGGCPGPMTRASVVQKLSVESTFLACAAVSQALSATRIAVCSASRLGRDGQARAIAGRKTAILLIAKPHSGRGADRWSSDRLRAPQRDRPKLGAAGPPRP